MSGGRGYSRGGGKRVDQEVCGWCNFKGSVPCQERISSGERMSAYTADRKTGLSSIAQVRSNALRWTGAAGLYSTIRKSATASRTTFVGTTILGTNLSAL